jgi:hypothetical protein
MSHTISGKLVAAAVLTVASLGYVFYNGGSWWQHSLQQPSQFSMASQSATPVAVAHAKRVIYA